MLRLNKGYTLIIIIIINMMITKIKVINSRFEGRKDILNTILFTVIWRLTYDKELLVRDERNLVLPLYGLHYPIISR